MSRFRYRLSVTICPELRVSRHFANATIAIRRRQFWRLLLEARSYARRRWEDKALVGGEGLLSHNEVVVARSMSPTENKQWRALVLDAQSSAGLEAVQSLGRRGVAVDAVSDQDD